MKGKFVSRLLCAGGLALLLGTAALSFLMRGESPRILGDTAGAEERTQALMEALTQGNLPQARQQILGDISLTDPDAGEDALSALWQAYLDSFQYTFSGGCYAGTDGLYRDVTVTVLDLSLVVQDVEARYRERLPQAKAEAESDEALVRAVLDQVIRESLEQELPMRQGKLTLALAYRQEQWWVVPDTQLLALLTGDGSIWEG